MSHEDGWWVLETADADRAVVDLVRAGHPFHDLEVAPLGLEAAVLHLIREDGRT